MPDDTKPMELDEKPARAREEEEPVPEPVTVDEEIGDDDDLFDDDDELPSDEEPPPGMDKDLDRERQNP